MERSAVTEEEEIHQRERRREIMEKKGSPLSIEEVPAGAGTGTRTGPGERTRGRL